MPFKPLVTAEIGSLLSAFLYRSPALKMVRSHLLGKVLRAEVKGFSVSSILASSEHQADVPDEWAGDADCTVIACAGVLPKLRDRQQLAALIRSGELEVQGGIQVVQDSTALADLTEFSPAGLLAPYTGDIAAEGISKALRGGAKLLHHGIKRQQCYVAEAITGEWRMTSNSLEVAWSMEETTVVKRAVDTLTKWLGEPEAR